jgi:uncharacterized protein (TIGR03032 family)
MDEHPDTPTGPTHPQPGEAQPWLEVVGSRYLLDWLEEERVSLAFTTYQTGKIFFVGRKPEKKLGVFERTFAHSMGLWAAPDARTLWMSSRYQLWRFDNVLAGGQRYNQFDALYIPRVGHTTGHLDVHDLAVDESGRVIFVNTMFCCLATLSDRASFQPLWRPSFVSSLAPEDRCHLNGLALRDGRPRYVTAVAQTDVPEGWRERRRDGGCVVDVDSGEVIAAGLSMPHSPRWYRDRLWVLNSGSGEFGFVDTASGTFQSVAFCPGYLRGLVFVGDHAVVTLSLPRHRTFEGLPLSDELQRRGSAAQCGLYVINIDSGHVEHTVRLEGLVTEMYDVVALAGVTRPMALGFKTTEIERMVQIDEAGTL